MIVTQKAFDYKQPEWVTDKNCDPKDIQYLVEECGLGEPMAACDAMQIDSFCFYCHEVLEIPYVYWHGKDKSISLHIDCAENLCRGILLDLNRLKITTKP